MPSVGDIVATLGIDGRNWQAGLAKAAQEADAFGRLAQKGLQGGSLAGRLGGLAGTAGELTGLALNAGNAQRATSGLFDVITGLVSRAGPWGFAIGTVAGAIGTQLIPKLFEGSQAAEKFAASLDAMGKTVERGLAKDRGAFGFAAALAEADSPEQLRSMMLANDTAERINDNELTRRIAQRREAIEGAIRNDLTRNVPGWSDPRSAGPGVERFFDRSGRFLGGLTIADDAVRTRVNDLGTEIGELEDRRRRLRNRADAIEDRFPEAVRADEARRRSQAVLQQQPQLEAARIGANVAAIAGTSSGFSSLQEALRQDRHSRTDEQVELLRGVKGGVDELVREAQRRPATLTVHEEGI